MSRVDRCCRGNQISNMIYKFETILSELCFPCGARAMGELYDAARRKALNVGAALDDLLESLGEFDE